MMIGQPVYPRTKVAGSSPRTWIAFPPISPTPVRDFRTVDFTAQIMPPAQADGGGMVVDCPPGGVGVIPDPNASETVLPTITEVQWRISNAPDSKVVDPDPGLRLIGDPTFDATSTTQLLGDMMADSVYLFEVIIQLDDGRILLQQVSLACLEAEFKIRKLGPCEVAFDYDQWIMAFPEFSALPEPLAQNYWDNASMLFANDCYSCIDNPDQRRDVLNLLTAHVATLFAPPPIGRGGSPTALVGALTNKSVGGVSVGSTGLFPGVSGTQAWYLQTPYGAKFWMLTRACRLFHYVQGPQRYPYPPGQIWPPNWGVPWPSNSW
jgi:hypothetical protein